MQISFQWITKFFDQDSKAKLVPPASFSSFLELSWKFRLIDIIAIRIYNLSSVPRIPRFLLTDTMISSKTNPCRGKTMVKIKNIKTMLTILLSVYSNSISKATKQYSSVLLQFKIWGNIYIAISFPITYFVVRR